MNAAAAARDVADTLRARRAAEQREGRAQRRLGDEARAAVPMSDEQIAAVAECLNRHGVAYVIVGGGAAQLHGAPITRTRDADVVPDRRADNLDHLAVALREMDARLWVGVDDCCSTSRRRCAGCVARRRDPFEGSRWAG